jgi:hypothetical protein
MREIKSHKATNDEPIKVFAIDEPGPGGANHAYCIFGPSQDSNQITFPRKHIDFQKGSIAECGVNGVTGKALLAILIDRLERFQAGPFANYHNALALMHLQAAMNALHSRDRIKRGVEGTSQE